MREIKFRAWDKNKKKIYLNVMFDADHCIPRRVTGSCIDSLEFVNFNDCIITQFTGLKDINGTEIYEGDITEEKHFRTRRIVVWHLHGWFIKELNEEYYTPLTDGDYEIVVGNIFENPELLEAKV